MPSRPGSCTWSACFRSSPKNKKPGSFDPGLFCCFVWLDGADAAGARALGARFDLEGHLLATAEAVEVAFGATPVEEEFLTVLGCNKAEATVRDQLLDGACRHFHLLYLSNSRPTQLGGPVRETEPAVSAGTLPATESIPVSPWTYSWAGSAPVGGRFSQAASTRLVDLGQIALAQPEMQWSYFQELVLSKEVERLLEAQLVGRSQAHRDVGGRRPDVGLLLLAAHVDANVARPLLDADDHPLVNGLSRLNEGGATLLSAGQPERERGAGGRGGEGAVALLPEFARPGPISNPDRSHDSVARGQRQEVVPEADQAARRNHVLEANPALRVVADLDHLASTLPERLRHRAEVLLADVNRQPLHGLHELAIDPLDDGFWARDLELIALPAHRFDEHGEVELAAAADQKALGRVGVLDPQAEVDVELLVQPRAQLPRG